MELDELKKSWNALNEQLQKEPIADEQQITELIAGYKANTRKSLGRLVVIERYVWLPFFLYGCYCPPSVSTNNYKKRLFPF